jgi:hypothetical protein
MSHPICAREDGAGFIRNCLNHKPSTVQHPESKHESPARPRLSGVGDFPAQSSTVVLVSAGSCKV